MTYPNEYVLRDAIYAAIDEDPDAADRELGRRLGCDGKTVAKYRQRQIEENEPGVPRWKPEMNAFEKMEFDRDQTLRWNELLRDTIQKLRETPCPHCGAVR